MKTDVEKEKDLYSELTEMLNLEYKDFHVYLDGKFSRDPWNFGSSKEDFRCVNSLKKK